MPVADHYFRTSVSERIGLLKGILAVNGVDYSTWKGIDFVKYLGKVFSLPDGVENMLVVLNERIDKTRPSYVYVGDLLDYSSLYPQLAENPQRFGLDNVKLAALEEVLSRKFATLFTVFLPHRSKKPKGLPPLSAMDRGGEVIALLRECAGLGFESLVEKMEKAKRKKGKKREEGRDGSRRPKGIDTAQKEKKEKPSRTKAQGEVTDKPDISDGGGSAHLEKSDLVPGVNPSHDCRLEPSVVQALQKIWKEGELGRSMTFSVSDLIPYMFEQYMAIDAKQYSVLRTESGADFYVTTITRNQIDSWIIENRQPGQ